MQIIGFLKLWQCFGFALGNIDQCLPQLRFNHKYSWIFVPSKNLQDLIPTLVFRAREGVWGAVVAKSGCYHYPKWTSKTPPLAFAVGEGGGGHSRVEHWSWQWTSFLINNQLHDWLSIPINPWVKGMYGVAQIQQSYTLTHTCVTSYCSHHCLVSIKVLLALQSCCWVVVWDQKTKSIDWSLVQELFRNWSLRSRERPEHYMASSQVVVDVEESARNPGLKSWRVWPN
jgi:hypothetical protein